MTALIAPKPRRHDIPARERVIVALDVPDLRGADRRCSTASTGGRRSTRSASSCSSPRASAPSSWCASAAGGSSSTSSCTTSPRRWRARSPSAARVEAELLTVHTSGGYEMLARAAEAAAGRASSILGVTVLTSLAEDDLRAEGIEQTIPEMVRARARIAAARRHRRPGLLAARDRGGARRGARAAHRRAGHPPADGAGAAHGDQKRVATARQAIAQRRRLSGRRAARARRGRSGRGVRRAGRRSRSRRVSDDAASSADRLRRPARRGAVRARPREVSRHLRRRRLPLARDRAPGRQAAQAIAAITVEFRPRQMVAELAGDAVHQGVVARDGRVPRTPTLDEILALAATAAATSAAAAAVAARRHHRPAQLRRDRAQRRGAGRARRRRPRASGAAPVTPVAVKASAGATERVRIAEVGNLMRTIDYLRERGVARARRRCGATGERLDEARPRRSRWRWSSAPRARGCARRWRGAATACSTSPSAARSRRSTRRSRARSRSTKRRGSDKSASAGNRALPAAVVRASIQKGPVA